MIKKYLKDRMPTAQDLHTKYKLGFLAKHLKNSNLWHFHSNNVARGVALGVFVGLLPIFGHMLIVPLVAIFLWPANLPVAMVSTFITNPATLAPISYFEYRVGTWVLGWPEKSFHLEWTWNGFVHEFTHIWEPMLLGSLVLGIIIAPLSYILVLLVWRGFIVYQWKKRHKT
jgi:uncharacterized protein (DUF2062 family)